MHLGNYVTFRLREILWHISKGIHDESLCKENCEQNRKLFNHTYHCQYSFTTISRSRPLSALLCKKLSRSPHQSLWNRDKVEHQELVKFDLKEAQFKAMEIEVQEGRRAIEDLDQLRIEMDEL